VVKKWIGSIDESVFSARGSQLILFIVILSLGVYIRATEIGSMPNGLNQDEASTGYDAFSILNYGIDRNGMHNPAVLISWGSGMHALYAYLAIPFIKLFGLTVESVRYVSVFSGILTLPVFFFLLINIWDKKTAFLGTLLLAISPWHIMISRWAIDENIFPAFFLLATFFLVKSSDNWAYLPVSFFFFALSLYSHGTAYFIVPVYLTVCSIYILYHKKVTVKKFFLATLIFILVSLPIFLFLIINIYQLPSIETKFLTIPRLTAAPRFQSASILFGENFFQGLAGNLNTFSKLMLTQNDGTDYNSIGNFGIAYLFSIPFALIGLFTLAKSFNVRSFSKEFFILVWFVLSVILAGLIEVNINRINIIFIPFVALAALGIKLLASNRSWLAIIVITYMAAFAQFTNALGVWYTGFNDRNSFGDAINLASAATNGSICILPTFNMPYIYVLFYGKIDPRKYTETVKYISIGESFQRVSSFDRYYFDNCKNNESMSGYVLHSTDSKDFSPDKFKVLEANGYAAAVKRGQNAV
jgi:4-amino-4-deoxy-L-arabinose transferase-like glycosyltransferase